MDEAFHLEKPPIAVAPNGCEPAADGRVLSLARKQRARAALVALESAPDGDVDAGLAAIEGLRARDGQLYEPCAALVRARNRQDDPSQLFDTGRITKSYNRDGRQYEMSFRIARSSEQCTLSAYRRRIRQPGSSETTRGRFGAVALKACACE